MQFLAEILLTWESRCDIVFMQRNGWVVFANTYARVWFGFFFDSEREEWIVMDDVMRIIKDPRMTYRQRIIALANAADNSVEPIRLSEKAQWFADRGIIYNMNEGQAPYRPRYVVPDYDRFMRQEASS